MGLNTKYGVQNYVEGMRALGIEIWSSSGVPTESGPKTGALVVDTTNGVLYINTGTTSAAVWNPVGSITAGEITLAEGSILVGNASGVATALDAKTSGRMLIGNGTTITSVAMSGDATINSSGALTIAAGAVSPAKQTTAARTRTSNIGFTLPAPTGSNQSNLERAFFSCTQAITITSVKVISSTATSGSDATNKYEFQAKNKTGAANLHTSNTTTQGSELGAGIPFTVTISQNLSFNAGDVFEMLVSITDDGSAGPTNLSAAELKCLLEYTI